MICINGKNEPIDSIFYVIYLEVVGYDPKKIKDMVDRMIKKEVKK